MAKAGQGQKALTCLAHHGGQELGDDGAPFPHLALFAVGEVGHHADDALGAGSLAGVDHDQQLHDGGVHVPGRKRRQSSNRPSDGAFQLLLVCGWMYLVDQPFSPPSYHWASLLQTVSQNSNMLMYRRTL